MRTYRDALTAVEDSQRNAGWPARCEATDENIANLRRWANDAMRRGRGYCGETHHFDSWLFIGNDDGCDWSVVVKVEDE